MKLTLLQRSWPFVRHSRPVFLSPRAASIAFTLGALWLPAFVPQVRAQCVSPPPNLVSWWQAEGDAGDAEGTNDGMLQGGATFTNGEVGRAFNFDGTSGCVIVPDSPSLRFTNQITIEAWINTRSTNADRDIVAKVGGSGGDNGYEFLLSANSLEGQFNSPGLRWPSASVASPVPIVPGTWNHVAFTYDQSALKLYFNGQPIVTNPWVGPTPINTSTSNLRIGSNDDAHNYFDGRIDEASIYNRALSASEIAGIYNAGAAGKCVPQTPPAIISQPQNQTCVVGYAAAFSVQVSGPRPLTYQWQSNSVPIPGATNAALTFPTVQFTNAGSYFVAVSNAFGGTVGSNAVLAVVTPTTHYVNAANVAPSPPYTNWSAAAINIQDAVNAAAAGDFVLVSNGLYQFGGRIVYGSMSNRVAVTVPLTVESVNGPAVTTILGSQTPGTTNGAAAVRCVYLTNGAVLAGFTLTNGATFNAYGDGIQLVAGGGVWCEPGTTQAPAGVISNCVLTGNSASGGGGGAYQGTLVNCSLSGNSASGTGGGAIYATLINCILTGNSTGSSGGGTFQSTLSGCTLAGNHAAFGGGGSYQDTLSNCTLTNNSTGQFGGGADDSTLNGCTVGGNSASTGGGTYQSTLNNCTVNINTAGTGGGASGGALTNCSLNGNVATGVYGEGGGAVGATLNNCILSTNTTVASGGGAAGCTLINCTLAGNSAYMGGGASGSTLANCTLSGNSAGSGGGAFEGTLMLCILADNSAFEGGGTDPSTAQNSLLTGNTADYGGGAFEGTLVNCTMSGNSATVFGGGAYSGTLSNWLYNCIVYYNSAPTGPNSYGGVLDYCCTTPLPSGGAGNITNAPLFVNPAGGDYHLQSNSPCINSGNNAYVVGTTDLDGNPRISGGTVDMGAYEFQNPASIISYAWLQQYGLATDGSADSADTDGNGMNNWQKWIAGLNPTNPASLLKMLNPTNTASGTVVTWESVNNRTYFLQRGNNLAAYPAFTTIRTNIAGQAGTTSVTDTNPPVSSAVCYRVGVQP
jgi:hypothetical protein